MSYRDSSGKKHEHDMEVTNLDVSNINPRMDSLDRTHRTHRHENRSLYRAMLCGQHPGPCRRKGVCMLEFKLHFVSFLGSSKVNSMAFFTFSSSKAKFKTSDTSFT